MHFLFQEKMFAENAMVTVRLAWIATMSLMAQKRRIYVGIVRTHRMQPTTRVVV